MKQRWTALVQEDRSIRERLGIALAVALFLSFSLCVFAPYETILTNTDEFWFSFGQVWWCFIALFAACFAATLGVGLLLRGKLFNVYICAVFGLALASYVEANFVKTDYGVLTGAEIVWERYGAYSLKDTLLWLVILISPFVLLYFSRKIWSGAVRMVCVGIVLVQFVTLATVSVGNPDAFAPKEKQFGFSWQGALELSQTENVLFIMLDEFDVDYVDQLLGEDSAALDFLDGFTWYRNGVGVYNITFPAVTQYLTGKQWYMQTPVPHYLSEAWADDELFAGMKARGFDVRILGETKDFGEARVDIIDNYAWGGASVSSYTGLTKILMQLVAFRCLPHGLKAGVWLYPGEIGIFADSETYTVDDHNFYYKLLDQPLSAEREAPAFRYIQLFGMHEPHTLDETLSRVSLDKASSLNQSKGVLLLLGTLIDQLKAVGIYDNTTIVMAADHGRREANFTELTDCRNPAVFVKPRDSRGALTVSETPIWTGNMKATLMEGAGLDDHADFGRSFLFADDGDGGSGTRFYYPVVTANEQNELVEYAVTGEANEFANWRKTGETWPLGEAYFD